MRITKKWHNRVTKRVTKNSQLLFIFIIFCLKKSICGLIRRFENLYQIEYSGCTLEFGIPGSDGDSDRQVVGR